MEGNTHVNKGKVYAPKGMLGTGWLGGIGGLYAEGRNLFETLMLNWVLYDTKFDSERYRLFGNNPEKRIIEMSSFRDDPMKISGCIVFPADAGMSSAVF